MADLVTSQILENGPRWLVMNFTGVSDGTGEVLVTKVDATSQTYANRGVAPGIHLKVREIKYDVVGERVVLYWGAATPQQFETMDGSDTKNYDYIGGLYSPTTGLTTPTGSILLTTLFPALDSTYTLTIRMSKCV